MNTNRRAFIQNILVLAGVAVAVPALAAIPATKGAGVPNFVGHTKEIKPAVHTICGRTASGKSIALAAVATAWHNADPYKNRFLIVDFEGSARRWPTTNGGGALIQPDFNSTAVQSTTLADVSAVTSKWENDGKDVLILVDMPVLMFPTENSHARIWSYNWCKSIADETGCNVVQTVQKPRTVASYPMGAAGELVVDVERHGAEINAVIKHHSVPYTDHVVKLIKSVFPIRIG